jgi:hypothetical protein
MDQNSYADMIRNWEKLLDSCAQNAALLPGFEPFRDTLAKLLADTKELKSAQDNFAGSRQATTQQVKATSAQGWKAARQLRAFVKAHLGPDSERLVLFGVQPIRSRPHKAKSPEVPAPAAGTPHAAAGTPQTHDETK